MATVLEVNKEYAFASAKVIKGENLSDEEIDNEILSSETYRKAIEQMYLDGISVELVGYWIWVTGNTYPVRSTLKDAGFFFASKNRLGISVQRSRSFDLLLRSQFSAINVLFLGFAKF